MDYNEERIGSNIRALRKKHRLSLNELAEATEIAPSYLGLIERGKRRIRTEKLCNICSFFKVSLDSIIYGDLCGGQINVARERDGSDIRAQIELLLRGASREELQYALMVLQNTMNYPGKKRNDGDMEY